MMLWTPNKYPIAMKHLDNQTREKAIEIANALLDEHYEKDRAAHIAIVQAKKWVESDSSSQRAFLHVVPHPAGWAVRRANLEKACFVFDSISEAENIAWEISRQEQAIVIIHNADGTAQNPFEPASYYEGAIL